MTDKASANVGTANSWLTNLHLRVTRHVKGSKGTDTRIICCWPVSETARKAVSDANIAEMQFDGDPETFSVGSEMLGNVEITKLANLMSNEVDENGVKTGKLVERLKLDEDGNPVTDDEGESIVLQRATLRFVGKFKLARVKPAEELAELTDKIA